MLNLFCTELERNVLDGIHELNLWETSFPAPFSLIESTECFTQSQVVKVLGCGS